MLQFHVTRLFGTQFKTHGVAIANAEGLRLVFREGEAPPKVRDDEIRSVLIPWNNFRSMTVERGFFGTKATITVHSASQLKELPGLEEDRVELKIHRKNLDQISRLEAQIARFQSGKMDEDVEEFVDDVRDMLEGY